MIKKIFNFFVPLAALVLLLLACQTNEIAESEQRTLKEKIEAFSRFESNLASQKSLQKNNPEYVSYHEPFQEIIRTFMNNNPSYEERFRNEAGEVYFNLRSFTYGEAKKGLAYPIMKHSIVNAVLMGIVNPERNWVNFTLLKNDSPEVRSIISKFQKFYDAPLTTAKGREKIQEEQIDEVVINVYESIPGPTYTYYQPYADYGSSGGLGGGMSGGSTIYHGGGGTGPNPTNSIDLCAKIKEKQNNLKYSEKFNALNKADIFNMDKERGFYEKQPPLGVNTEAGFVQVDGPPGSTGLDLPDDTTGISGLFHSHNNADGSIKIFSPTDVKTFINTFLKNAGTYGGGYANAYSTVVTSEGSYTIKYTGTAHPGGVDYYAAKSWGEWYEREMGAIQDSNENISQEKVEAVFTRFLQEIVNKPGLEVYKVTANTASKMTYNPTTKKADKVDCP